MGQFQYTWKAVYSDGTCLEQIDKFGKENSYANIDRSKLIRFDLMETAFNTPKVVIHLKPGMKLIARRRVMGLQGNSVDAVMVWLVGWHQNVAGENIQLLVYVFEDGHMEIRDRFEGDHVVYGKINLREEEK